MVVQDAAHLVKALVRAIKDESIQPINEYAHDRNEFCKRFLQPTTTANHSTVDNPDEANRRLRLSELFSDSKKPDVELQVVARASMITELVK
jgi:hypothetical protein